MIGRIIIKINGITYIGYPSNMHEIAAEPCVAQARRFEASAVIDIIGDEFLTEIFIRRTQSDVVKLIV